MLDAAPQCRLHHLPLSFYRYFPQRRYYNNKLLFHTSSMIAFMQRLQCASFTSLAPCHPLLGRSMSQEFPLFFTIASISKRWIGLCWYSIRGNVNIHIFNLLSSPSRRSRLPSLFRSSVCILVHSIWLYHTIFAVILICNLLQKRRKLSNCVPFACKHACLLACLPHSIPVTHCRHIL